MLISRNWLQPMFADPLPSPEELERALTFHAFEIDGVEKKGEDFILDVKVTPNRGHDCLCHRGIAKELSAILKLPMTLDALKEDATLEPVAAGVSVSIDTELCSRYIAGYVKGVKVGPSPDWLRERLESIGQRSINNVVDATNFVMFHLGQPLHAFDAGKLEQKDGTYAIAVRPAKAGERMLALDEKEYALNPSMLVIADANKGEAVGIAGVKGGMPAGITDETADIIIESANFDGAATRKAAQALKLRTDASARFEQVISPELAAHGMKMVSNLIHDLAGGELIGFVDIYPRRQEQKTVSVSLEKINRVLGVSFTGAEVADSFERLGFAYKEENGTFEVHPPFERLDLVISEDLVEEVGRIQGYEKVPAVELPVLDALVAVNPRFYRSEKIREFLAERGFSEVFTSVFAEKGERVVLNKVDGVRPYLRTNIQDGLAEALERNVRNKELLGLSQVKLFEIGTVWHDGREETTYELAVEKVKKGKTAEEYKQELEAYLNTLPEKPEGYDKLPLSKTERYQPFSKYPYIVRDIAMWTPKGTNEGRILEEIRAAAGELCVEVSLFDRFEKGERMSLAYRLIFQSFDRTLTDEDANAAMERVYAKMRDDEGFEIR